MKQILHFPLLAAFFCLAQSAQAQIFINEPADPGDNYGNGTQNMIGQRHYFWDADSSHWDNADTFNMHYNQQNLMVLQNWLKVDTSVNGPWKNSRVTTIEYDANNRISVRVDTTPLNPAGGSRYEYTYNANGQSIMLHQHLWNNATSSWINAYRDQTTYTAFDSINVLLSEFYNSNTWVNNRRAVHVYNTQNLDSIVNIENWNSGSSQWLGSSKHFSTYDANGNEISYIRQVWINHLANYRYETQSEYSYDTSNRVVTHSSANWDTATNGWKPTFRYTYSYNAQGLMENRLMEKHNSNTLQWDFWSLTTYTYDANNRLQQYLEQDWTNNTWGNNIRHTYTRDANGYVTRWVLEFWNDNTLSYRNYGAIDYWYEAKHTTGIQQQPDVRLNVFPNPSNSGLVFVNADKNLPYAVYDMQGRMVTKGQLQNGTNSIILNDVAGTYILKAGNSSVALIKQ